MFYFIPNLTSIQTSPISDPWTSAYERPTFPNKDAYRLWCNNPTTQHAFITAVEGRVPGVRVSETNPACRMSGLVLDYDAMPPAQPASMLVTNAPADLRPAYVSRTFSGNCRVLFLFEAPIPLFTPDIAREFLRIASRALKLRKLLPGFEQEALLDLSKLYEIGTNWEQVGQTVCVIPETVLTAWLMEASARHRWEKEGAVIPIESLREEGEKRFPDKWPGGWANFDLGARGPRFWDESASDPTAVTVRESGCQYYSDGGGWMTWEQIFGPAFVRKWAENRKGKAIVSIWHDGKNYWRKLPIGEWSPTTKGDIQLDLLVDKRLSAKSAPQAPSEIDTALYDIQTLKSVTQAMPFLYRPDGPYNYNGKRYLNISTVRPIMPVPELGGWGEGFPWIAQFLETLFDPQDQLDYFLAWLKHFYMGAVTQEPRRGLALFIAGPVGAGKTLLNKAILGQLMGGRQDAGKFLLGGDQFNDKLFRVGLWCVDDEVLASDPKQRALFTQMVKRIVANDSLVYRAMYNSGEDMEWLGRPVITLNNDPESLQMLPETDRNVLDKLMLLLTKNPSVPNWLSDAEIAAELPFLGAFLRDWPMPEQCIPDKPRFGVKPYRHEELMRAAGSMSTTSSFEELLQLWRKEWFAAGGPGANETQWVGNPTALHQAIALNESLRSILERNFASTTALGMHLNKLQRRGADYLTIAGHRAYAIARPE